MWEESWDDDDTNEDFSKQLKYGRLIVLEYWWLILVMQGGVRKGERSKMKSTAFVTRSSHDWDRFS